MNQLANAAEAEASDWLDVMSMEFDEDDESLETDTLENDESPRLIADPFDWLDVMSIRNLTRMTNHLKLMHT